MDAGLVPGVALDHANGDAPLGRTPSAFKRGQAHLPDLELNLIECPLMKAER